VDGELLGEVEKEVVDGEILMIVDLKESGEKCGTKDEIIVQNISDEVKVEKK
jgi:hypothetical protein